MRFCTAPLVLDAIQWTGTNGAQVLEFCDWKVLLTGTRADPVAWLETADGQMRVGVGGWIIKGDEGQLYTMHDSIFREICREIGREPNV